MSRISSSLVLTAALASTLALAACKRDNNAADTTAATPPPATTEPVLQTPPPATTTPAPATGAAPVTVTAVDLGSAVGPDNRVSTAATTFKPTDTIYASIATDGAAANVPVTARWTYQDGQVVHTETRTLSAPGPTVTEFHISKPGGWPAGTYKVEISAAGAAPQVREFTVR